MAEADNEFIKKMEDNFTKTSLLFEKASLSATGKDEAGTAVQSPLLEMVTRTRQEQTDLAAQIAELNHLKAHNQPIGEPKKKAAEDALKTFEADARKLKEGLDFVLDAQPLSTFAWIVFLAGVVLLMAV